MTLRFTVYGVPAPKGSTKAFYRPGMRFPVVTEDNLKTRLAALTRRDLPPAPLSAKRMSGRGRS